MQVSQELFKLTDFENTLLQFCLEQKWLPDAASLHSERFLSRSVVPHIQRLSALFNRLPFNDSESNHKTARQELALDKYWNESSNPENLRLAYLLYFMPSNLFRVASVWNELYRLGYRWPHAGSFRGIEFGAGPATAACGISAGEHYTPLGLPSEGNWALIEQDKAMLDIGVKWANHYWQTTMPEKNWSTRPFHRTLQLKQGLLPKNAPRFHLWVSSYFINELDHDPQTLADALIENWDRHVEEEGLIILVEPALKQQSRKLLKIRKALIEKINDKKTGAQLGLQILLPCLGHQECGALAAEEDWCHEEVSWWRPPYFHIIDRLANLDRKTLPFSYLVIAKSKRTREEILPKLAETQKEKIAECPNFHRLVSPPHKEGGDHEFFLCGTEGKCRARLKRQLIEKLGAKESFGRGSILVNAEIAGDTHASRVHTLSQIL